MSIDRAMKIDEKPGKAQKQKTRPKPG